MRRFTTRPSLTALLVLAAALLPRLYALGAFLTIDEVKWAEGAAQFLTALSSGNLAATYWHFFPGITISWGGALALWGLCLPAPDLTACANAQVEHLPESIGWLRLSPVLWTSLGVVGVYVWGRQLLGDRLALLAALLLAFDPFFIAHSRILNGDASAAILMFLSLITFLNYWLGATNHNQLLSAEMSPPQLPPQTQSPIRAFYFWRTFKAPIFFLIISGLLAGLALLTKLPAPLIGVFVGGLGLAAMVHDWRVVGASAVRRWVIVLLIWGGLALIAFVILWPAMWTAPLDTLRLMYVDAFEVGGAGEGHDTFFLGQISADPGPWFYLYVIAFRLTPVVMMGLGLAGGWLAWVGVRSQMSRLRRSFASRHQTSPIIVALIMLSYILAIILFSNASPKKLDRYVMSVIPALILLAAIGLDVGVSLLARLLAKSNPRNRAPLPVGTQGATRTVFYSLALTGVLALQLLFAVFATPYYLTYYNPLLGGVRRIADRAPVGWGEGLEQAAFYLNGLPKAESLRVSSWYSDIFNPYFVGDKVSFSDDGRAQLGADYVVFYMNQIQRRKPFPGLVDYFRSREPEFVVAIKPNGKTVNLSGGEDIDGSVPWVEVYRAPAAQVAGGAPKIEGIAQLLAYKVTGATAAAQAAVTLYLRVLGPLPEGTTFDVALTQDGPWGRWQSMQLIGEWQAGQIVEWRGVLTLPPDMPPGDYRLRVVFAFEDGPAIAEFPISDQDPPLSISK